MIRLRRRTVLWTLVASGSAGMMSGLAGIGRAQEELAPTPSCDDGDDPTPAQTEGPYFTPNSPERWQLREPGMAGTPIVLTGSVVNRRCEPVAGALVELWHSDDAGLYDNDGYRLRGHQFTEATGLYRFATIVPGLYAGRTRHFHLKFQAPGRDVLTTQFYFPGEPGNERDRLFDPALLLGIDGTEKTARFDVVLA